MSDYYVVSDIWCGKAWFCGVADAAEAERLCRNEVEQLNGDDYADEADMFSLKHFRAWPVDDWPHHLTFEEAFDWIGQQRRESEAAGSLPRKALSRFAAQAEKEIVDAR